ncbi:CBS domain-containing protein [Saccharopolyspora erythraea]|uniref:CBS domain-containing protein n=1 Tax=Saccharopolyspora erythraea TaxID=1836 RepID=UPI001BA4C54D|nr:CBS domain-containing protein [Saccharopolyspora erythraea]QUH03977.1 CBS domain-containing protein [Saccharopolyspora erythraea]
MTTAREIMSSGAECVRTDQTAADAARLMAELGVGGLPICGPDDKIKGVVTDRDLIVKVVAQGRDVGTFPAGDLNQAEAVTVGADDPAEEVLATMGRHKVRRLPVIDGQQLVGMISLSDVARSLPHTEVGELVDALSTD